MSNYLWIDQNMVRFSEYHLEIASGLLKELSKFINNKHYDGQIHIDVTTCD